MIRQHAVTDRFKKSLRYSRVIEGWFSPNAAKMLSFMNQFQIDSGIRGNFFEIGVHHGKMSVILGSLVNPDERLGVCDLFGVQEENISHSGDGSLDHFLRHWDSLFPSRESLTVFSKNSNQLSLEETSRNCRVFSIDGGHSSKETFDDLVLASKATLQDGLIVLDDFFEPGFPGVAEGACRFFEAHPNFVPLLFVGGRMFICQESAYAKYLGALQSDSFKWHCEKNRIYLQWQTFYNRDFGIVRQFTYAQDFMRRLRSRFSREGLIFGIAQKSGLLSLYRKLIQPKA